MNTPKSILITGASSGIGEALALEYARPDIHLSLSGRNPQRLGDVAQRCRDLGAVVMSEIIDVTDQDAMATWISKIDSHHPIDLIIANAGISAGAGGPGGETYPQVRAIFDTNLNGVLNTIWPAIHAMRPRGRGHVVLISSQAGLAPFPGAPAYSASKAAVKAYGEALHGALADQGIVVTTVFPGFVKSRITDKNDFPMPFFMEAPKAAKIMRHAIATAYAKRRITIVFPRLSALVLGLMMVLPSSVRSAILSRAPKKTSTS